MKVILDTCTFLWIITDAKDLSAEARRVFSDPRSEVFLSAVSTWEMAVKIALGRLSLPSPPERFVPEQRRRHHVEPLPLDERAALHLLRLPALHRDPFDRMLVCQAMTRGMAIMTPDERIMQYAVPTVW
jgi:PIN domain nuclease of toxin-antitoxin system